MLDKLTQAALSLPPSHPQHWVVDCQSFGGGNKALVYLGRHLYRGVIQGQDILACHNGRVTFRYRSSKTKRHETRTLAGEDFLWLLPACRKLIAALGQNTRSAEHKRAARPLSHRHGRDALHA